jgi:hypothetical protein
MVNRRRFIGLLTRPTKKTDSRAKGFKGESVEVDAIPPNQLRQLVHDCIVQHVDEDALAVLETAEQGERETLKRLSASFRRTADEEE